MVLNVGGGEDQWGAPEAHPGGCTEACAARNPENNQDTILNNTLAMYLYDSYMYLTPVPRKWYFSYGTSSCITYFKLREYLTLIK